MKKTIIGNQTDQQVIDVDNWGEQGDLRIVRCKRIPDKFQTQTDDVIVAHSETGHHHVVDLNEVDVFHHPENERKKYIRLKGESANVIHMRDHRTHKTQRVVGKPGDVFKLIRQVDFWKEQQRIRAD